MSMNGMTSMLAQPVSPPNDDASVGSEVDGAVGITEQEKAELDDFFATCESADDASVGANSRACL